MLISMVCRSKISFQIAEMDSTRDFSSSSKFAFILKALVYRQETCAKKYRFSVRLKKNTAIFLRLLHSHNPVLIRNWQQFHTFHCFPSRCNPTICSFPCLPTATSAILVVKCTIFNRFRVFSHSYMRDLIFTKTRHVLIIIFSFPTATNAI